jgi:hypothetical protein
MLVKTKHTMLMLFKKKNNIMLLLVKNKHIMLLLVKNKHTMQMLVKTKHTMLEENLKLASQQYRAWGDYNYESGSILVAKLSHLQN